MRIAPIEGWPGYSISDEGQVIGRRFGRAMTPRAGNNGYLYVSLSTEDQQVTRKIHRLVALAFIPNPDNKPQVNHRNGIKTDNRAENLEWATSSENNRHAHKTGLHPGSPTTPVIATHDKTGEQIRFVSQNEAGRNGFDQSSINHCLAGRRKTHRGYRWKYAT